MFFRSLTAWLIFAFPVAALAANDFRDAADSRPACGAQNQGQMWPDAANRDHKLLSRLVRCGQLVICVRGTWRYHWETPTVRLDQLGRDAKSSAAKPSVCEAQSVSQSPRTQAAPNENQDSPSE